MYKITQLCLQMLKELKAGKSDHKVAEMKVSLNCILNKLWNTAWNKHGRISDKELTNEN